MVFTIIAVITASAGAFWGGMQYQKSSLALQRSGRSGDNQFAGENRTSSGQRAVGQNGGRNGNGGTFENGEIIAKDEKSITLKTRDGSSKIIYFSDSTTVGKTVDTASGDLGVGQTVMVNGKSDSAGILTAQNIQIRPEFPDQNP